MFDDRIPVVIYDTPTLLIYCTAVAICSLVAWRSSQVRPVNSRSLKIAVLIPLILFFLQWLLLSVNVPDWDDFDSILEYLALPESSRISHLFDMHNEHRIATVRLLSDLMTRLFGCFNFKSFMLVGNIIQATYAVYWYRIAKNTGNPWIGVAACWLLTSLLHWENSLWALCSVQNTSVLILALISIVSSSKGSTIALLTASICAVTASFTSGSGILIWPCMVVILFLKPLFGSGSWRMALQLLKHHALSRRTIVQMALISSIAAVTMAIYFLLPYNRVTFIVNDVAKPDQLLLAKTTIMGYQVELTPTFIAKHIMWTLSYTIKCLGGILPFRTPSFILGIFVLSGIAYIFMNLPKLKHPSLFGFLLFNLGCIVSCSIFRAGSFDMPVASRYRIVCMSAFVCTLLLLITHFADFKSKKAIRYIASFSVTVSIGLSLTFLFFAGPRLYARQQGLRNNILVWPEDINGLRFGADRLDLADKILRKCIQNKIYDPSALLRDDERRPVNLVNVPL